MREADLIQGKHPQPDVPDDVLTIYVPLIQVDFPEPADKVPCDFFWYLVLIFKPLN